MEEDFCYVCRTEHPAPYRLSFDADSHLPTGSRPEIPVCSRVHTVITSAGPDMVDITVESVLMRNALQNFMNPFQVLDYILNLNGLDK